VPACVAWQVGSLMAELVHEPAGSHGVRRPISKSAARQTSEHTGLPGVNWHLQFNQMALDLISLTTTSGESGNPKP
jgi:hypothetical protein